MSADPRRQRALGLFGRLMRAYPAQFRERFGEGMEYAFGREHDRALSRGNFALARFWAGTALSMGWHGVAERLFEHRSTTRFPGMGGGETMEGMIRELRHAARRLARRPGFTLASGLTLALGIGATTAIYSVVYGVLLKPLPYAEGDRLVIVDHESATDHLGIPAGGFLYYSERSQTLDGIGVWVEQSSPVAGTGEALELNQIIASNRLLPLLGIEPVLGRGFVPEDHVSGAEPVALVSHGFWVRRLGADPDVIGQQAIPGYNQTVIGVLPEGFEFMRPEALVSFGNRFDAPDVFFPLGDFDPSEARFGNFVYRGIGHLAPGHTVDDARAELTRLMVESAEAYPGGASPASLEENGYRPLVSTIKDAMVGDVSRVLWILLGAVGFVLVIAMANVANLLLVRAESRTGEMAVRRALGASRGSLVVAFLSESALLALLGGLVGLGLAGIGTDALIAVVPGNVPRLDRIGFEPAVLAFAFGATTLAATVLTVVTALRAPTDDLRAQLVEEARGHYGGRTRLRDALVAAQVALALVLLVGSGLLVETFQNLRDVDPGFDPESALTLRLPLSGSILRAAGIEEPSGIDARRSRFMLEVTDRLAGLPGVQAVGFSADLPLDGDEWHDSSTTDEAMAEGSTPDVMSLRVFMGPGYLRSIGATLASGRELDRADFAELQPRVAVVNESFAAQRWPGQDPIGRRIAQYHDELNPDDDVWYTVVGVVEDIREAGLMNPTEPTIYLPTIFLPEGDFYMWVSNLVLVVRTTGDPMALLPRVRAEILDYRPDVPINDIATLKAITARSFGDVSFAMALVMIAAVVALFLGVVGIYGTVSYVVGRRTREFGLRIALGASAPEVTRSVLRDSGRIGLIGIALGAGAAALCSRVLESMLFEVSGVTPSIYGGVAALLFAVVLVAALVPARRAASVDPVEALKAD